MRSTSTGSTYGGIVTVRLPAVPAPAVWHRFFTIAPSRTAVFITARRNRYARWIDTRPPRPRSTEACHSRTTAGVSARSGATRLASVAGPPLCEEEASGRGFAEPARWSSTISRGDPAELDQVVLEAAGHDGRRRTGRADSAVVANGTRCSGLAGPDAQPDPGRPRSQLPARSGQGIPGGSRTRSARGRHRRRPAALARKAAGLRPRRSRRRGPRAAREATPSSPAFRYPAPACVRCRTPAAARSLLVCCTPSSHRCRPNFAGAMAAQRDAAWFSTAPATASLRRPDRLDHAAASCQAGRVLAGLAADSPGAVGGEQAGWNLASTTVVATRKADVMSRGSAWPDDRRITVTDLQAATDRGERWSMLTSYDVLTAGIFEQAGVRALLVGDTSAELVLGYSSTLPVTMAGLISMTSAVVAGTTSALVVADLNFGSYQAGPEVALANAVRHLKEGGAQAVKLEGSSRVLPQVRGLVSAGIPVKGHLALNPQSVHLLGGLLPGPGRRGACAEIRADDLAH